MRLDQLVKTKYPHDVQMREAVRRHARKLLRETNQPQSGAYYWVPKPDLSWRVVPFYDVDYRGRTPHDEVWKEILEYLAIYWHKDPDRLKRALADSYTGLPRGRVSKISKNGRGEVEYVLVHGNDSPGDLKEVIATFNLKKALHRVMPDDHETMTIDDPRLLQKVLGVDLGLKGQGGMFDDEDYDYGDEAA